MIEPSQPNPPDDRQVRAQYEGEQGEAYHRDKRLLPPEAYVWVARVRAEKLSPHVDPQDTVVEYGVGLGWNLAQLRCRRRIGFDVGAFLAPSVEEHGIEFVDAPAKLPDGMADVVICHHVLEHVLEPSSVLREILRILRPQGKLLLFVPYEKERRYRKYNPQEPNRHLFSWNVQTLGALVEQTGFHVAEGRVAMFSYDRFSSVAAARLRLGEGGYRLIRRLVHALFPCLEVRVVARPSGFRINKSAGESIASERLTWRKTGDPGVLE